MKKPDLNEKELENVTGGIFDPEEDERKRRKDYYEDVI